MEKETKSGKDKYGVDFNESWLDTCSAHDCTGLIPALPQSEAEIESYDEVYQFLPKARITKEK